MQLEPRASWFSPKCVEAQQLKGSSPSAAVPAALSLLQFIFSSADVAARWLPSRQPPPCTPRRCTVDSDFSMSAAGLDLTSFIKG